MKMLEIRKKEKEYNFYYYRITITTIILVFSLLFLAIYNDNIRIINDKARVIQ